LQSTSALLALSWAKVSYSSPPRIFLRIHAKLDAAVAPVYGWPADLNDEEMLERLLALNMERAAEEKQAAKTTSKKRSSRIKVADEMI
jgi:hypothetical protein